MKGSKTFEAVERDANVYSATYLSRFCEKELEISVMKTLENFTTVSFWSVYIEGTLVKERSAAYEEEEPSILWMTHDENGTKSIDSGHEFPPPLFLLVSPIVFS
ncbi:hypothetical protein V1478_012015 [Vespula squamosa]|uniref:Uncharacterized protein n=1 Tax=Vespula squamosa TaxID=30214 RepID=A0ABD2ABZ9_VESSQ